MSAHSLFTNTPIEENTAYLDDNELLISLIRDTVLSGLSSLHELNADVSLLNIQGETLWLSQKSQDYFAIADLLSGEMSKNAQERLFANPIELHGKFYYLAPIYSQFGELWLIVALSTAQMNSNILLALLQSLARESTAKLKCQSYIQPSSTKPFQAPRIADLNIQSVEKALIIEVAKNCRGKVQQMHQILNMGRTTLWRKLKQYDINIKEYK
ncbi:MULTISPECIES: helix-turn-helix domain-containing protein [Providencia]|uniref:helix-turn-helix domain-containing protein n=1 Tax=Providencia TaxID=586 RepID=UPI00197EFF19|nr:MULTISPECIES: helix-turn-helix domain-containing protein [Providencia]MBN4864264.1 transcriptional regulator [Providencia stuartii]MBN4873586.1 transcriptional regulator [Providencia stuartii]MBN4877293.1 transcriptional regulator [Providencia stuartii]MBN4882787.1 transcriptional regulator [Providencia stuartii]HEM8292073.1 transcriptional regulator [Providencia stuartii]